MSMGGASKTVLVTEMDGPQLISHRREEMSLATPGGTEIAVISLTETRVPTATEGHISFVHVNVFKRYVGPYEIEN